MVIKSGELEGLLEDTGLILERSGVVEVARRSGDLEGEDIGLILERESSKL